MLEIYSTKTCPHCITLKKQLEKAGIAFTEKDTDEDTKAMSEMVAANIWTVPTVKYNGIFIDASTVEEIKEILKGK